MTSGDNVEGMLRRSTERFVAHIADLTDDRWQRRPEHRGWNASEITEHVTSASRGIHMVLNGRLEELGQRARGVDDDEIPYLFYRGDEPPNVAAPTGTWTDPRAARKELEAAADALLEWHRRSDLDLRSVGAPHPVFGILDAAQWLLFAQAHTERHRAQLIGL